MTSSRTLQVPAARLSDLGAIRTFVGGAARELGMDADAVEDLVLVVDEATTNVIRHGYGGQPGPIDIDISTDDGELIVQLRDEAPPFDPTTYPTPDLDLPLEQRGAGGMGIHLARLCLDRMEHDARPGGGNELTLALRLTGKGGNERYEDDR